MAGKDTIKGSNRDSEKYLERELVERIELLGGKCIKLVPLNSNGIPDRLCLLPGGIIFFAEIKSKGQKPRKLQLYWHRILTKLGFIVHVIDSYEKLNSIISYE
jgi:hypothetical protein